MSREVLMVLAKSLVNIIEFPVRITVFSYAGIICHSVSSAKRDMHHGRFVCLWNKVEAKVFVRNVVL